MRRVRDGNAAVTRRCSARYALRSLRPSFTVHLRTLHASIAFAEGQGKSGTVLMNVGYGILFQLSKPHCLRRTEDGRQDLLFASKIERVDRQSPRHDSGYITCALLDAPFQTWNLYLDQTEVDAAGAEERRRFSTESEAVGTEQVTQGEPKTERIGQHSLESTRPLQVSASSQPSERTDTFSSCKKNSPLVLLSGFFVLSRSCRVQVRHSRETGPRHESFEWKPVIERPLKVSERRPMEKPNLCPKNNGNDDDRKLTKTKTKNERQRETKEMVSLMANLLPAP